MSKPRKLSCPEIDALAAFFGCRVATMAASRTGAHNTYDMWDVYIVHGETKEKIGVVSPNNPAYLQWTNHDWTRAFQRISGMSTANLWEQGKRGGCDGSC
jgi:hypothetical protein